MISSSHKLFKNSAIYTAGNIVQKGDSLFFALIVSRFLVVEDFGKLMIINLFSSVVSMSILSSITGAVMRFYIDLDNRNDRKIFIGSAVIFIEGLTLFILAIIFFGGDDFIALLFPNSGLAFFPFFLFGLITMALNMPYSIVNSVFRIKEEPSRIFFIQIFGFFLKIAFITSFLCYFGEGLLGVIKGQLFAAVIMFAVYFYYLWPEMRFKFAWKSLRPALLFSLPLAPYVLFSFLRGSSDRFFIEKYLSMEQVGIYSMGLLIGNSIGVIVSGLAASYSPRIFNLIKNRGIEKAKNAISKISNKLFLIMFFPFVMISIFSKEILFLFVSDVYQPSYVIIPLAAFTFFLRGLFLFYNNTFYWTKKTVYVSLTALFSLVVTVVGLITLIPRMGIIGAGLSNVLGHLTAVIFAFYWAQKVFFIKYDFRPLLLPFFIGSVCVLLFVFFTSLPVSFFSLELKLLCISILILAAFRSGIFDLKRIRQSL